MASVPLQHYARTMLAIAKDGIPADGDEPAFSPQKCMTGTGDLAYQQKSYGDIGGGCKGKHDPCTLIVPAPVRNMIFCHMSQVNEGVLDAYATNGLPVHIAR